MAKIGLVAMSAKPYHAGHDGLVRMAAEENDTVLLFVSLSDRKRPGEIPILGKDMETIWKAYIQPTLPANVEVEYGGSPVSKIYKTLGDAALSGSEDVFSIYSDPVDLEQNYPENSLEKYAGILWQNNQIILTPVERTSTVNVSGTKMRKYLSAGNKKAFTANLPSGIDKNAVWKILYKKENKKARRKSESLLRAYIKLIM
jgi:ATP sulfurylase